MCPEHQFLHKQGSEEVVMVVGLLLFLFANSEWSARVQTMEFLLTSINQTPFVNGILVLQLNLFFPVELRVCSCVRQGRFLLFHQVPAAARFVLVWVGIANDSVVAYSLFSTFV